MKKKPADFEKAVKEWGFNQGINRRDEIAARMTSPLACPRIGIEAAWRKIYNLTAEHKHPRQTKENEREIEI